jgi:hypothetical protein
MYLKGTNTLRKEGKMIKFIKIGKHSFSSMDEFKAVQNLAIKDGLNSIGEFEKFLDGYFSK